MNDDHCEPPQKVNAEPPQRHRLPFQPFDFRLHRRRQRWGRSFSAELSELVLQTLFGFIGDVPDPLLGLEVGDELSGKGHRPIIGEPSRNAEFQKSRWLATFCSCFIFIGCRPADPRQTNRCRPSGRRLGPNVLSMPYASIAFTASA